jgi:hypothetical protein
MYVEFRRRVDLQESVTRDLGGKKENPVSSGF